MQLRKEILRCSCHSKEHEIEFAYDDEYFYAMIHLTPLPFWQRVKHAFKYIFGYRCSYGDFEEMIFTDGEIKKLITLIHDYSFDHRHFMEGEKTKIVEKGKREYPEQSQIDMI